MFSSLLLAMAVATTTPPPAAATPPAEPATAAVEPAAKEPPAGAPKIAFVGVDENTPAQQLALLLWNQTDEDIRRNGTQTVIWGIYPRAKDDKSSLDVPVDGPRTGWGNRKECEETRCDLETFRVAALAPGTYDVWLRCDTPMTHASTTERVELAAGKRYRIACVSRARQRIRVELTEM